MDSSTSQRVVAIMPTYNSSCFIVDTLQSLANQTWTNLHILIGDDCSTDATFEIVSDFGRRNPNVEIVRNKSNLGWVGNTNALLNQADGEYAFFAFHDDLIEPTFVEKLVKELVNNSGAVLAYPDVQVIDENERVSGHWRLHEPKLGGWTVPRGIYWMGRPSAWWVGIHGVFRLSLAKEIGGLRSSSIGEIGADWPWLLHLATRGRFVRVPEVLCSKRYTGSNLSRTWRLNRQDQRAWKLAGVEEVMRSKAHISTRSVVGLYGLLLAIAPPSLGRIRKKLIRLAKSRRTYGVWR